MRLFPEEDHHLLLDPPDCVQLVAGPGDRSDPHRVQLHDGAPDLEVEVVVGVDDGEELGIELVQELRSRLARRLAGIAPALEGDQRHRILEDRSVQPLQRGHEVNLLLSGS